MSIEHTEPIRLRTAGEEDAEALLDIYAPYVEHTAVSFEYEVPSVEEFRERIRRIRERYPYLLAESEGEILGYAYASPFHERRAYDWAAETSIYLRRDRRRQGLGGNPADAGHYGSLRLHRLPGGGRPVPERGQYPVPSAHGISDCGAVPELRLQIPQVVPHGVDGKKYRRASGRAA